MHRERANCYSFLLMLQLLTSGYSYANEYSQMESNAVNYGGFLSAGFYESDEADGLGFSFGATRKQANSMYTLRYTLFLDLFGSVDSCKNKNGVIVCNADEDDHASITETALLYGQRWGSFWFSGGLGYIKGNNVSGLFSDETINFSDYGFAYSVLWQGSSGWFFFWNALEFSGNINSEINYFYTAVRYSF